MQMPVGGALLAARRRKHRPPAGLGAWDQPGALSDAMEVAAAGGPDAAPGAAGLVLGALEAGEAVEALALEAVDLGPAATKLSEFKLAPGDEGMGEKTAVAVFCVGN